MSKKHARSPMTLTFLAGIRVFDMLIAGEPCPLCRFPPGEHRRGCVAGEAIVSDPVYAERALAAKEELTDG